MPFNRNSIILILALSLFAFPATAENIKVMTFNLRIPVDPAPYDWQSRLPRIISIIKKQRPDVLGVQEVTPAMLADLTQSLPDYIAVGRGREADSGGEGTQILIAKAHWELDTNDQGTLQLSPTPDVPGSNGWNMQWPRIFTWVRLREKTSGKFIYVFNTHFPLKPGERDLSAQLLAKKMAERKHFEEPVILTGDFNACETENSMNYLLGAGGSPIALKDAYRELHPQGNPSTFHAFGKTHDCKIDYIYVSKTIKSKKSEIIKDDFASDHYAVIANLRF